MLEDETTIQSDRLSDTAALEKQMMARQPPPPVGKTPKPKKQSFFKRLKKKLRRKKRPRKITKPSFKIKLSKPALPNKKQVRRKIRKVKKSSARFRP